MILLLDYLVGYLGVILEILDYFENINHIPPDRREFALSKNIRYMTHFYLCIHCKEWVSASCVILVCLSSSFVCPCSFLFASCGLYLVSIKGMFSLRPSFFFAIAKATSDAPLLGLLFLI